MYSISMSNQMNRPIQDKAWVIETLEAFEDEIRGPNDLVRILNRESIRRRNATMRGMR